MPSMMLPYLFTLHPSLSIGGLRRVMGIQAWGSEQVQGLTLPPAPFSLSTFPLVSSGHDTYLFHEAATDVL